MPWQIAYSGRGRCKSDVHDGHLKLSRCLKGDSSKKAFERLMELIAICSCDALKYVYAEASFLALAASLTC